MSDMARQYAGATVVGFYGEKSDLLTRWLIDLQDLVAESTPGFVSRPVDEIHATIIGLEFPTRPVVADDILGLVSDLAQGFNNGLRLRLGGRRPSGSNFTSRGQDPYERAFSLSGGQAVLIGWPDVLACAGRFHNILAPIRRQAEKYGFRHRYHINREDSDPDLYMVIGSYDQPTTGRDASSLSLVEDQVRNFLADHPFDIELGAADLRLVRYRDNALGRETSSSTPLTRDLAPDLIQDIASTATALFRQTSQAGASESHPA